MRLSTITHTAPLMPIPRAKIYATFGDRTRTKNLSALCFSLLSDQKKKWLDLRRGCESLKSVRERHLRCSGFSVRLQHNPGRIRSSLADVSKSDGIERVCFLCLNHLPEGQEGILYRDKYLILCNPMPIFPFHFTLSHLEHRRQAIAAHIDTLLRFMVDFGPGWAVLYNGPRCGASAPDHLHFQAVPSGQMPIEKEIQEKNKAAFLRATQGVFLYRLKNLGREVVLVEGEDPVSVAGTLKRFLNTLGKILLLNEEPMINIAGFSEDRKWRLVIFPRRKHRPDAFFREGEDRVLVSPGIIDMGGLLITPLEKDFNRLDPGSVEEIYKEVSLDRKTVESTIEAME